MSKSGRTVAEVAAGLDVTEQTIYDWLGPGAHRYRTEAGAEFARNRRRPSSYRRVGDRACIAEHSTELLKSVVLPKGGSK
ncbi:hypothetical protein [Rhodococcus sp. NPDC056516]|uniref:hypothetical protein n=1 Tax=Rhodococcus sp. NPDC056516 TaxID=3345847 RepID=UPI00366C792E